MVSLGSGIGLLGFRLWDEEVISLGSDSGLFGSRQWSSLDQVVFSLGSDSELFQWDPTAPCDQDPVYCRSFWTCGPGNDLPRTRQSSPWDQTVIFLEPWNDLLGLGQ